LLTGNDQVNQTNNGNARLRQYNIPKFFRGDAAFANPALYRLTRGGRDATIVTPVSLDRFHVHRKWKLSAKLESGIRILGLTWKGNTE